jgi:hypothetical protein
MAMGNNYGGIYGYDTGENSMTATARIETQLIFGQS